MTRSISVALLAVLASCTGPAREWIEPHPVRLSLTVTDSLSTPDSILTGSIADGLIIEDGSVALLDMPGCRILLFRPDGGFAGTAGGPGSGPGEFSMPAYIAVLSDGTFAVADMTASSVTIFDSDWEYLETLSGWTVIVPMKLTGSSNGTYTALLTEFISEEGTIAMKRTIGRFGAASQPEVVYSEEMIYPDFSDACELYREVLFATVLTSDREGRVFFAGTSGERWSVTGMDTDGNVIMELALGVVPVPKTPEELEAECDWVEAYAAATDDGLVMEWDPDPLRPMVEELGVDGKGNLWVKRGTEVLPVFDVFDRSGMHVATVELALPGTETWTFRFAGERALAWSTDPEDGVQRAYLLDLPTIP